MAGSTIARLAGGVALLALAGPALAQDDVAARLSRMEAQLRDQQAQIRRQQATIDAQANAIRDLREQTRVPDELAGQPVLPTDVFLSSGARTAGPAAASSSGPAKGGANSGGSPTQPPYTGVDTLPQAAVADAQAQGSAASGIVADKDEPPPSNGVDTLGTSVRRALDASRALALADLDRPRVSIAGGRPTILSSDGRYSLSIRGLAQLDTGFYDQRSQGRPATDFRRGSVGAGSRENNAAQDLSNGANFRRARLGVEGVFDRDFNYRLMVEFGGSGTEGPARINDAWIAYTGFAPFTVQIGAFSPPANMDDGQSPEDQLFLERASAAELSRTLGGADGRVGIGVRGNGRRWFGAVTATGPTVNDAEAFDEQSAVVGRGGVLLLTDQDQVQNTYNLQLGLNGTYVFNTPDQGVGANPRAPIRFRDRPELRLDGTRLVDTGAIDADNVWTYGAELGAQYRQFYVQAEAFRFGLDRRDSALPDPRFQGGYAEASWVLTGEFRRYNGATGSFQNPRPYESFSPRNGGFGAFELAARYSYLDLDYGAGLAGAASPTGAIRGGRQEIVTLGLNWYLNSNFKLLFDYLHVDVNRLNPAGPGNLAPFGTGTATPPIGAQIGQKYDAWAVRSQFAF